MTKTVLSIFEYFKHHKSIMWTVLLTSTFVLSYFGAKVEYEEDITSLLPKNNNGNEKLAFSNLRVKDKLFVLINYKGAQDEDLDKEEIADKIIEYTDEFVEAVVAEDSAWHCLQDVLYTVEETDMLDALEYITTNFPAYITEADYAVIDSLLNEDNIAIQMQKNKQLISGPQASVMKDIVRMDPIGMKRLLLQKMLDVKNGLGNNQIMYQNHFLTPDSLTGLAYISPSFKSFDSKSGRILIDNLNKVIRQFEASHPDIEILTHGAPVQSVNNSKQIKKDLSMTVSISLLICILIIGFCFKNKNTIFLLILPVLWGSIFALTCMYLLKGSMSLMALGIGAIVLGVALSYCLHVMTHYKYVSNPEKVIVDQAKPITLGCITTIGSFAGLLFTQSDLLKDFGLFASFALLGTTLFSLIFLPHFFNEKKNKRSEKAFRMLEKLNSHPFEKHKWLIAMMLIITFVCFYTQRFVTFDSDLQNINYNAPQTVKSRDLLAEKTQPGQVTVYYASSHTDLDKALSRSRDILFEMQQLKDEGVINNFSQASTLFLTESEVEERMQQWADFWDDEKQESVMQMVNRQAVKAGFKPEMFSPFQELISTSELEYQNLYESEAIPQGLLANMIEYTDGVYMVFTPAQMKAENKETVGNRIAAIPDCVVIDPMFYANDMVKTINNDFNITLYISMAFVFVVLLLSFRNLTLSLLAMTPMVLSWFIVLGIMGLLGLKFNLINIVISTFIFGIGVDYSIFIMEGLLSNAKMHTDPKLLIYHKTAIFLSAVVLIIFTASLLFATHPAIKSIGLATIIGMSSAVLLAYTLQPFLFKQLVKFLSKHNIQTRWMR